MKWFDYTALTLVIIGAVNWLLIGIFRFDLVRIPVREYELAVTDHLYTCRPVRPVSAQRVREDTRHIRITGVPAKKAPASCILAGYRCFLLCHPKRHHLIHLFIQHGSVRSAHDH